MPESHAVGLNAHLRKFLKNVLLLIMSFLQVFRFDPRTGTWLQVAAMLERRTRFHTEVIGERIIAVGGGSLLGHLSQSVEEYNPAENKWEYTSPFPIPVADHAGTTQKGILYISGECGYWACYYSYRLSSWILICLDCSNSEQLWIIPTVKINNSLPYSCLPEKFVCSHLCVF